MERNPNRVRGRQQLEAAAGGSTLMAGRAGSVPPCATTAAAVTVDSGSRDGMFVLEVKVQGFAFKDSAGRKSYTKGHVFKWDVEYGSMTFDLLLKNLTTELNLSTDQTPTVWFFDKRLNEDARIVGEIQMLDLFEMYKNEMSCQVVVGVFDRSICVQTEFDAMEPLCVVPHNDANVQLEAEATATLSKEPSGAAPENPEAFVDVKPDREHDIFDNAEEYVGVDDEAMYGIVPVAPQFAKPTDNANSNVHEPTCDEPSDAFFLVEAEVEAEVDDADPLVVQVLHDPNNPKIVEGELFPNIVAFRKAIRHYAVTKGFELAAGYKSDKSRFTARCAAEGCPWRIHASTIFDKKTVQIKKLPSAHNCPTTKLQVGRMASQGWCSDKLGDWVKKNPTKKAKEAKEKLEGDFGIKLKYSKAWSGLKVKVSDDDFAEVTLRDDWDQQRRYTVDLKNHSCSCREWQVTSKPCKHALAWILSNRGMLIADFVHEYYSVARFRAAYEGRVEPMTDRSQWPQVDLGFKVHPPLLGRPPGRPKVQRQRSYLENDPNKRKVKCKRCGGFGHFEKTCKLDMVGEDGEVARPNKRKRTNGAVDDVGPSKAQKKDAAHNKTGKKKKSPKKKISPKKKKTPLRQKQQKDAAAPPARVVRSLMDMFSGGK